MDLYTAAYNKLCEDEMLMKALKNEDIIIINVKELIEDAMDGEWKDKSEYAVIERIAEAMDFITEECVFAKYYEMKKEKEVK